MARIPQTKSERQKKHYWKKKEKRENLKTNVKAMTSTLAAAEDEHEQLTFMGNLFQKLLHSADQLIVEMGRLLSPRKERQTRNNTETSASAIRLSENSNFSCKLLLGPENIPDEYVMEIANQPVEILAELDKWWLAEMLEPCRALVANPGDVKAREELNRWAKRRKHILYSIMSKRPIDVLELASIRIAPQRKDGEFNPRLFNLPREMKLTPEQHDALSIKWQAYKLKVKEAPLDASASLRKASLTLNALDGIEALKLINNASEIRASELVTYFWDFVGALKLSQRASMVLACAPYSPDPLQISAILFDNVL